MTRVPLYLNCVTFSKAQVFHKRDKLGVVFLTPNFLTFKSQVLSSIYSTSYASDIYFLDLPLIEISWINRKNYKVCGKMVSLTVNPVDI